MIVGVFADDNLPTMEADLSSWSRRSESSWIVSMSELFCKIEDALDFSPRNIHVVLRVRTATLHTPSSHSPPACT